MFKIQIHLPKCNLDPRWTPDFIPRIKLVWKMNGRIEIQFQFTVTDFQLLRGQKGRAISLDTQNPSAN